MHQKQGSVGSKETGCFAPGYLQNALQFNVRNEQSIASNNVINLQPFGMSSNAVGIANQYAKGN
jgi:hypothetical protein